MTLSILGECALALENEQNAREKEAAALLAEKEQLRANLLRAISHDLRTPLTSILGNASNFLSNGKDLDEPTKEALFKDIYDDAMWLINLVENLLSVSRLEENQLNLNFNAELVSDVIEEALKHINRNRVDYELKVEHKDEFLLAKMDARLIVQVIINLVDNAIKYNPKGSQITITTEARDGQAVISVADMDGIEVIRTIRSWSHMPIIVISARSEDSEKIEALDAGADDYLTKPFSVEELLARLRVTQRRLSMMPSDIESSVFINGGLKIDYAAGCAWLGERELHLTPIEYKLLCLLARNVGRVLTHTYITQHIWGRSWDNDVSSLRVFMATLRKKLEAEDNSPQYIQTHVGVGYRMLRVE